MCEQPGSLEEADQDGLGLGINRSLPWLHWSWLTIGGLRLWLGTLRQTVIVHVRHPRHSFPFRCSFFLFPLIQCCTTLDVFCLLAVCMVTILCLYIGVIGVFLNHNCACNVQNNPRHLKLKRTSEVKVTLKQPPEW